MIYSRKEHYLFLEEELRAQTDQFKQKFDTSASYLLNVREELFISQFVKIENGEMILKFSTSRGLPRKGEYLYCFTTPNHLHQFKEWDKVTYGDLLKSKGFATEAVCIWQASLKDDPKHCLVGFRGVDLEFAEHVDGHPGAFLILGPNVPPTQYISKESVQKALRNINKESDERNIQFDVANTCLLPKDFDYRSPDNMILSVAMRYKDENPIMITSDNGLQVKCKIVGIPTISTKKFLNP